MELFAKKREIKGSKVANLRKIGQLPAVLYSKKSSAGKSDVLNVQLDLRNFTKIYSQVGQSTIFTLDIENDKRNVLVKSIQRDSVSLLPLHVEFYEVDMSQTLDTEIPVEIVNEENCEPITSKAGIAIKVLDKIEVRCLPKDIPQVFNIDVSVLKAVGDALTVRECIIVDKNKIEILTDQDEAVVKIDYAEQLITEEETTKSVEEVEVISEKEKEERAKQKEGTTTEEQSSTTNKE